jgi:putative DNA primase/helicase
MMRFAKETAASIIDEARAAVGNDDLKRKLLRHAIYSASAKGLWAMLRVAESEEGVSVQSHQFDNDPFLLNTPTGTVDLRTGNLLPHAMTDMISCLCPTPFVEGAECPGWDAFLGSVFDGSEEMIGFMRRLFGYAITGAVTEDTFSIFLGPGANGKTAMLHVILGVLGPDYSMTALPKFLMGTADRHPTELMDLRGRRLVVIPESPENGRLDESLLKTLTGRDAIRARRMHQDNSEFKATHKFVLATNHLPQIGCSDNGTRRRLRVIPFPVQFWNPDDPPNEEHRRPEHLKQEKGISDRLLSTEASGILAWAVRGCLEWKDKGLGMPPEAAKATADYRTESDIVSRFIASECATGPAERVKLAGFHQALRQFAAVDEEEAPPRKTVSAHLTRRGFEKVLNNGTWFKGIGLRTGKAA